MTDEETITVINDWEKSRFVAGTAGLDLGIDLPNFVFTLHHRGNHVFSSGSMKEIEWFMVGWKAGFEA